MTDRSYAKRALGIVLIAVLGALILLRGVIPAFRHTDSDFGNYLTAAKIVASGGPAARLYDDGWFEAQMHRFGTWNGIPGKFTPFPPPTALLLVPLAALEPLDALRVMTLISLAALAGAIVLLRRLLSWSWIPTSLLVLGSGFAIVNALRFGQPYLLVSLACIGGFLARAAGRPRLAGVCLGVFIPIKYFPVIFVAYLAWRREWRLALAAAAAAAAVVLVSIAVLGIDVHVEFLRSVLGQHLVGRISLQDPFTASFQSFDSLLRRLFVPDPADNPHPWWPAPGLRLAALVLIKAAIVAATAVTLVRLSRRGARAVASSIGLLGIATLLLAPATASYHFVLLWLPVGWLAEVWLRERRIAAAAGLLACYALIGYFPSSSLNHFDGQGVLTVLAYSRLWLKLAMFLICIQVLRRYDHEPG